MPKKKLYGLAQRKRKCQSDFLRDNCWWTVAKKDDGFKITQEELDKQKEEYLKRMKNEVPL